MMVNKISYVHLCSQNFKNYNYVLLLFLDDGVQQFVDEFEPPPMAVQPGPSKPKAKSDGSSSELEVIFDSETTEQKTKKSTGKYIKLLIQQVL